MTSLQGTLALIQNRSQMYFYDGQSAKPPTHVCPEWLLIINPFLVHILLYYITPFKLTIKLTATSTDVEPGH